MGIKLYSRVSIPSQNDEIGTVIVRKDFLAGYSHYIVELVDLSNFKISARTHVIYHENELNVLNKKEGIKAPKPDPDLPLGAHVAMLPDGDFYGIITAHARSGSGCVEYEVTGYVPFVGPKRVLLEAPLLVVISEREQIETGEEGGSYSEREVSDGR